MCILPDLAKWKVAEIHHYNRKTKEFFRVGFEEFCVQSKVRTMAGRKRAFLSEWHWFRSHGLPYKKSPWCAEIEYYGGKNDGMLQLGLFGEEQT